MNAFSHPQVKNKKNGEMEEGVTLSEMIVADCPEGDVRALYESFRRSMFCDENGKIFNLIRPNKLVTVLGEMKLGVGGRGRPSSQSKRD